MKALMKNPQPTFTDDFIKSRPEIMGHLREERKILKEFHMENDSLVDQVNFLATYDSIMND